VVWLALSAAIGGWSFYAVPVETFTFLFTDIEGSTVLLGRVGQGVYERVLADHRAIIRSGLAGHGGQEVDTQGDAFFAVFSSAPECVAAVLAMQQALEAHAWPAGERVRVRMGVHTGQASRTATGLVGVDVHRAARVGAPAHGGQVLLSQASVALVREALPPGAALGDLGVHRLKDLEQPERIFQLRAAGLPGEFPPLRTVPGGAAAATRTLPRDLASFTGRQRELAELVDAACTANAVLPTPAIPPRAAAGRPGRRAGQPAADPGGSRGEDPCRAVRSTVPRMKPMRWPAWAAAPWPRRRCGGRPAAGAGDLPPDGRGRDE